MLLCLALGAGCSNLTRKDKPRVDQKDATPLVDGGTLDAPRRTTAEIRQLYSDAHYNAPACKKTRCRDEMRALMKTDPDEVAAAAFEILTEPDAKTDQGIGQEVMFFLDDWLRATKDEDARRRASKALEKVLAVGNESMRNVACAYLGEYRLPDARRILIAEVDNPARNLSERGITGNALGRVLDDFSLIRSWLLDEDPVHWHAALNMISSFEAFNNLNVPLWDEVRGLLITVGKRPDLPSGVVYVLARFYGYYLEDNPNDPEVRPLAERWTKHPDYMAAGQMRMILTSNPTSPWPRP